MQPLRFLSQPSETRDVHVLVSASSQGALGLEARIDPPRLGNSGDNLIPAITVLQTHTENSASKLRTPGNSTLSGICSFVIM